MRKKLPLTILVMLIYAVTLFAGDKVTKIVDLKIDEMHCPVCATKIKKALDKVDGVTETQVVLFSKLIKVTFDTLTVDLTKLTDAVSSTGYKVTGTHVCKDENECKDQAEPGPHHGKKPR